VYFPRITTAQRQLNSFQWGYFLRETTTVTSVCKFIIISLTTKQWITQNSCA